MTKPAAATILVFADQLYPQLFTFPRNVSFYMIEDPDIFTANTPEGQLVYYRAAMQAVREHLLLKGHRVYYLEAARVPTWSSVCKSMKSDAIKNLLYYKQKASKEKKWQTELKKSQLTATTLPSPGWKGKNRLISEELLPKLWQPQPNRYIEEAREYVAQWLSASSKKIPRPHYPVTHADAEDYLADFLKKRLFLLDGQNTAPFYGSFLPLLLYSGLLLPTDTKKAAEEYAAQKQLPPAALTAFLRLLR